MAVRVPSMSGRASAASVAAITSANGRSPHWWYALVMKSRPDPVDRAGSGSSTAYPRAASSHGFHRQDQEFQLDMGPPWTHSSSGAGLAPEAPRGRTSQLGIGVPSSAAASISVRWPGSVSGLPGLASRAGFWPSAASSRTGVGGSSTDERSAYTYRPSGDGLRSV